MPLLSNLIQDCNDGAGGFGVNTAHFDYFGMGLSGDSIFSGNTFCV
jgi:hypothetical protein